MTTCDFAPISFAWISLQILLCLMTSLIAARVQEFTRGSCVVGWAQLDNQTQDPVAPVVVAPTMVEHPQATLQMSFIRNNVKSHSRLNHFEVRDLGGISSSCGWHRGLCNRMKSSCKISNPFEPLRTRRCVPYSEFCFSAPSRLTLVIFALLRNS